MELIKAIDIVETFIPDPKKGLPEDVFLFISRTTPLINVDLLIKNEKGQTLLTWRDDSYYSAGWHVPGGIIRFKEKIVDRVRAVARTELGTEVAFDPVAMAMNELMHKTRGNRGHFISLLYQCRLLTPLDDRLRCSSDLPKQGEWMWHDSCPENLISVHDMYRPYI